MKKFALMALLATVMVAPYAISSASGTRVSDTPECCLKKQGCCPGASCCPGPSHAMGAHCMLHKASH
jgi:hypothetical protein